MKAAVATGSTRTAAVLDRQTVEQIVASAARAPSIHNTQPWSWHLHDGILDVRADRSRQLAVADGDGHSLLVSCGAAAELTALALLAQGWVTEATGMPDATDPDLLMRLRTLGRSTPDPVAQQALAAADRRCSDRRVFGAGVVGGATVGRLKAAAAAPGVHVHITTHAEENIKLAVAVSGADRAGRREPGYLAELAAWVRPDDGSTDGVPLTATAHTIDYRARRTDIPLRDFDPGVAGGQLIANDVCEKSLIAVVFTENDGEIDRLRAGQAMMRLMIQCEREGLASCPLSQSVDLLSFRSRLRVVMSWPDHPQILLRLGPRPAGAPMPPTPRRPVSELLVIE